jgi:hypothetical protein
MSQSIEINEFAHCIKALECFLSLGSKSIEELFHIPSYNIDLRHLITRSRLTKSLYKNCLLQNLNTHFILKTEIVFGKNLKASGH